MSDYPIRVEITRDAADELYDLAAESGCSEDWVRALEKIPRVPEPEQRACVGCRFECTNLDPEDGFDADDPDWTECKRTPKGHELSASGGSVSMPWPRDEGSCSFWQPRRDKAEELAEELTKRVSELTPTGGSAFNTSWREEVRDAMESVLREAGIGGESDE